MDQPKHTFALVGFAVLLIGAGCSGFPTDEQATAGANESLETISYPDGWSSESVDPTTAVQTHRQTLAGRQRQSRIEITDDEGANRTVIRSVDPNSHTASVRFLDSTFATDTETYYTTGTTYEYDHTTGTITTIQNTTWNSTTIGFQASNMIHRPLTNLEIEASDLTRTNGATVINYSVRGIEDTSRTPPNVASGYVIVSERGFITAFDITKSNTDYTRRFRYDLVELDATTVSEPVWLPSG